MENKQVTFRIAGKGFYIVLSNNKMLGDILKCLQQHRNKYTYYPLTFTFYIENSRFLHDYLCIVLQAGYEVRVTL